jgi:hypothetical protein
MYSVHDASRASAWVDPGSRPLLSGRAHRSRSNLATLVHSRSGDAHRSVDVRQNSARSCDTPRWCKCWVSTTSFCRIMPSPAGRLARLAIPICRMAALRQQTHLAPDLGLGPS